MVSNPPELKTEPLDGTKAGETKTPTESKDMPPVYEPEAEAPSESGTLSSAETSDEEGDGPEELYFAVASDPTLRAEQPVESDIVMQRCQALRKKLRLRPTLPLKANGQPLTIEDLNQGLQLPLYSCPFVDKNNCGCTFHTTDRVLFLHHIAGGIGDPTHEREISLICKTDISWMSRLDYVYGAIAVAERERWPALGLSTTRRSLNLLAHRYNDQNIQCISCFVCGQLRTTCSGYTAVDINLHPSKARFQHREIDFATQALLENVE